MLVADAVIIIIAGNLELALSVCGVLILKTHTVKQASEVE